jgi:hypothetical protein
MARNRLEKREQDLGVPAEELQATRTRIVNTKHEDRCMESLDSEETGS